MKLRKLIKGIAELLRNLRKSLSKYKYCLALLILIVFFLIIIPEFLKIKDLVYTTIDKNTTRYTLHPICMTSKDIDSTQKEMEILTSYIIDNARQIIWIRGIFLTIIIGISAYILKEQYSNNDSDFSNHKMKISIFMLAIAVFAFSLEIIVQAAQAMLINRVWQLDYSINKIISPNQYEYFQDVFIHKEIRFYPFGGNIDKIILIYYVITAPTFFIFYLIMLFYILLFPQLLNSKSKYSIFSHL